MSRVGATIDRINVPWSPAEVDALNRFQQLGFMHPFTCPNNHGEASRDLVATRDGWICPHCDYRQDWAHAAMLSNIDDPLAEMRAQALRARISAILSPAIDMRAPYARVMLEAIMEAVDEGVVLP